MGDIQTRPFSKNYRSETLHDDLSLDVDADMFLLCTQWTYKPVRHCPRNYCAMCHWSGTYEAEATREGVVCHRFGPWQ